MQAGEGKFVRSHKYKRKRRRKTQPTNQERAGQATEIDDEIAPASCDTYPMQEPPDTPRRRQKWCRQPVWLRLMVMLVSLVSLGATPVDAFCPARCQCDDQALSANCTQVSSLSIVPMTLNPLLRSLTLSKLPIGELGNSLAVYRQLETLKLTGNQLRSIQYENFNCKSAPNSLQLDHQTLSAHNPSSSSTNNNRPNDPASKQLEVNTNNEILARHLKQTIDKSVSASQDANVADEPQARLHLRELDLSDNRIETLGSLAEEEIRQLQQLQHSGRLRGPKLERLAPFLTLTRLERLILAGNRLISLHQHVFLGLVHVRELDLSRNQIEFVHPHALVGLVSLELLRLSQNKLAGQLHSLSLAFCRAPANELRYLDLSDNRPAGELDTSASGPLGAALLLPNEMFICAPRLLALRLDGLGLSYIQLRAFDNIGQLEYLNLSRNQLEQVPVDALTYVHSNLSSSLRQLDLSSNQIEFVSANAFGSLKNLQKLCLNTMSRLVSFDLASLHHLNSIDPTSSASISNQEQQQQQQHQQSVDRLIKTDEEFRAKLRNLLPGHLVDRMAGKSRVDSGWLDQTSLPGEQSVLVNHNRHRLINEQLIELQLGGNVRLESLHSSLSPSQIHFARLKLLDLHGASELHEVALDEILDLDQLQVDQLRVDLSLTMSLNCSSCRMGWLAEAAREQMQRLANMEAAWSTTDTPRASGQRWSRVRLIGLESIGCSRPFRLSLAQMVELETSSAPLLAHCRPSAAEGQSQQGNQVTQTDTFETPVGSMNDDRDARVSRPVERPQKQEETPQTATWQLAGQTLVLLLVVLIIVRVLLSLVAAHRRHRLSVSPSASILESPGSSTSASQTNNLTSASSASPANLYRVADDGRLVVLTDGRHRALAFEASDASITTGWPDGHWRVGNLFSRIVARWSGDRRSSNGNAKILEPQVGRVRQQQRQQLLLQQHQHHRSDQDEFKEMANGRPVESSVVSLAGEPARGFITDLHLADLPLGATDQSSEFVYANCQAQSFSQQQQQSKQKLRHPLQLYQTIIEPQTPTGAQTNAHAQQHQRQMLLKQLEAMETPAAATCARQASQPPSWPVATSGRPDRREVHLREGPSLLSTRPLELPPGDCRRFPGNNEWTSGALVAPDGHIYVTLDRPIRQRNGRDEYVLYERPQFEELLAKEAPGIDPVGACASSAGQAQRYKSFEWSSNDNAPTVGPLEIVDKFKLDTQESQSGTLTSTSFAGIATAEAATTERTAAPLAVARAAAAAVTTITTTTTSTTTNATTPTTTAMSARLAKLSPIGSPTSGRLADLRSLEVDKTKNGLNTTQMGPNRSRRMSGAEWRPAGNVTGASDCNGPARELVAGWEHKLELQQLEKLQEGRKMEPMGQSQLFRPLNGRTDDETNSLPVAAENLSVDGRVTRTGPGKYDANHDAATAADATAIAALAPVPPQTAHTRTSANHYNDYVINGLSNQRQSSNADYDNSRFSSTTSNGSSRSATTTTTTTSGDYENHNYNSDDLGSSVTAPTIGVVGDMDWQPSSVVLLQQQTAVARQPVGRQLGGRKAPGERLIGQRDRLGAKGGSGGATDSGQGGRMEAKQEDRLADDQRRLAGCDYLAPSQQKVCDSQTADQAHQPDRSPAGGANNKGTNLAKTLARANNEIYANQFYYCKPAPVGPMEAE